jgi:hypothetical protein
MSASVGTTAAARLDADLRQRSLECLQRHQAAQDLGARSRDQMEGPETPLGLGMRAAVDHEDAARL